MELKCSLCGKIYNNRPEYTECVLRCDELLTAREDEEKRKKASATRTELETQYREHYAALMDVAQKLEAFNPEPEKRGVVYEIVFPKFDWSGFIGA